MSFEDNEIKIRTDLSLPFGTISWIVWVVFMIMDYGCHMEWIVNANNAISVGGHFWTWFPFWLPFALFGVCLIFAVVCALIAAAIENR